MRRELFEIRSARERLESLSLAFSVFVVDFFSSLWIAFSGVGFSLSRKNLELRETVTRNPILPGLSCVPVLD